MNEKHLTWAKSHDWGRDAFLNGDKLLVLNIGDPAGPFGVSRGAWIEFNSFKNLRLWAGY